jgi:hypothetical protein
LSAYAAALIHTNEASMALLRELGAVR